MVNPKIVVALNEAKFEQDLYFGRHTQSQRTGPPVLESALGVTDGIACCSWANRMRTHTDWPFCRLSLTAQ